MARRGGATYGGVRLLLGAVACVALLAGGCAPAVKARTVGAEAPRARAKVAATASPKVSATAPVIAAPTSAAAMGPLGATAPPDAASDAHDIVAGVEALYGPVRTFKARFKQRYFVNAYDLKKGSQGSVSFEKPNKMSWRYDNGNRVVSDGQLIWIYHKSNERLYEGELHKTQFPGALSFVLGQDTLEHDFKLTKRDAARLKFASGYTVQAEPLVASTAYERLLYYIDLDYRVRRVLIIDAQGNRNRFDFSGLELSSKMPEREFEFTPPPGTQLIRF